MKEKAFLFRLLYSALIEIRAEAHDLPNPTIFAISNLLHHLPLQINQLQTEAGYAHLVQALRERAEHDRLGEWFAKRRQEFEQFWGNQPRHPQTGPPEDAQIG
ncbi:MAG: hypothetical protein MUC97_07815 [Bernardetiaceae bacterium]|jgi:hypothetical protein|nr:hypothetical protein [Bernardetiaceae bacterium]